MTLAGVAALVGLALVDSTSIGTLVLPLVLLLAPRPDVRRYLVFLATVGGFYALVGIGLVLGASAVADLARDAGDLAPLRWAQLVLGVVLLAVGVLGDPRRWFGRRPEPAPEGTDATSRTATWRARLTGPGASYRMVVGVGLGAALVEVASMLPFLAAVGIITAADLAPAASALVVLAYAVVMVMPALLLLLLRLALGDRVEAPLARLSGWLDRTTAGATYWIFAIVGLLLAGDAAQALDLT
ncbi:GAP family protein [Nocardioides alkalitolerans]|uniref:GAP family protein n=1 Tax=Nocardioides alkalitolerans TaxID=281714 RepID=UPI0004093C91|nr:GAP family protein [Nocardioides alkalitolerans]